MNSYMMWEIKDPASTLVKDAINSGFICKPSKDKKLGMIPSKRPEAPAMRVGYRKRADGIIEAFEDTQLHNGTEPCLVTTTTQIALALKGLRKVVRNPTKPLLKFDEINSKDFDCELVKIRSAGRMLLSFDVIAIDNIISQQYDNMPSP